KRAQAIAGPQNRETKLRRGPGQAAQENRRKQILRTLKDQEKQQKKATLGLSARMNQAGLGDKMTAFWIWSAVLGVIVFGAALLTRAPTWSARFLAIGAAFGLPRWVVAFVAAQRINNSGEALPDGIDIFTRGIKSGVADNDSIKVTGQ